MASLRAVIAAATLMAIASNAANIRRQSNRPPIEFSLRSETGNFSTTISEANDLTVTFYLTEPFVCPPENPRCRVVILLHNGRPDELVLSSCHVIWNTDDDYLTPRNITISTVENFVDDGQRTFFIDTEVNSAAALYSGFHLPDIVINTEPKNVATCSSTTDPNYRQWDGGNFVINTAGTFSLWKAPLRDWEVQSRVNSAGFNCGVAIRDGCDRYVVDRCSGTLVMRQYPGSSDGLAPRITRENGDTYVFTSQRAGAVVRVRERVRIVRNGRSICGWSGCRVIYSTSRSDWLDISMTAPGRDWGFIDNTNTPRTTGVCGSYNGIRAPADPRDCHVNSAVASNSGACSSYVSNFLVRGRSLFQETPSQCRTPRDTVVHNYDFCDVPPRPIQRPIIQTIDIEDITDLILGERPEDRVDDRVNYNFNFEGVPFVNPTRPVGFQENATRYCTNALLNTQAATLCQLLNFSTSEFVQNCVNDMMFQANESAFIPGAETDSRHGMFAMAQLEEMQSACVNDAVRRRHNIRLTCSPDDDCETTCVNQTGSATCTQTCIGDCTIHFNNTNLETLIDLQCPNDCGANSRINGTVPGQCVRNSAGRNMCQCLPGFTGIDCSIVEGEQPIVTRLFPYSCDISNGSCPFTIDVEGEEFYETGNIGCLVRDNGVEYEMNATLVSGTIIRCKMPLEISHSGAAAKVVTVAVALDGSTYSEPLAYSYVHGKCMSCNRQGSCNRVIDSCVIDNECYSVGENNPSNPTCQVCHPSSAPLDWTYEYVQQQCGPNLRVIGGAVRIPENQAVGDEIVDPGVLPFRLNSNPYTDSDTNTPLLFQLQGGDSALFAITSTGGLVLRQAVDYESRSTYQFTLVVSRGGLNDSMVVNLRVVNRDEEPTWNEELYDVTVPENTINSSLITVDATDPDGSHTEFGRMSYSLRAVTVDPSALQHFSIDPTSGLVSLVSPLNFEDGARRSFVVICNSGGGTSIETTVVVTVTNVNEAPTAIRLNQVGTNYPALTLSEGMAAGAVIGDLVVDDPDRSDQHILVLLDDAGGEFEINSANQLVAINGGFDYETLAATGSQFFTIRIRATDTDDESFDQELLLTVSNSNEAPFNISIWQYDPATLSRTANLLMSIPEDQPVGVVGILTVEDQDAGQSHWFTIEGLPEDSSPADGPPFRIYGNELRLVRPLNYEQETSHSISIYAIDNGQPTVLQSATQSFTINVEDRPDLPGYFIFIPAALDGVSENTPANTEIGFVSGLDQDPNQNFQIELDGPASVSVGPSTCVADSDGYTNCTAALTLVGPIDFESNRVSATAAVLEVSVRATDVSGSVGSGSLYLPVLNAQDAPTGVLIESLLPGAGAPSTLSEIQIEEAQMTLPRVARLHAFDPDDSCPTGLEGCSTFTPTGSYTFTTDDQSGSYTLSAECGHPRTASSRRASGRYCEVVLRDENADVSVGNAAETLVVTVTDNTGLSTSISINVVVIPPQVRVAVSFTSVSESIVTTSGTQNSADSVGSLTVSGWTLSEPPTVTLTGIASQIFSIAASRRRDAPRTEAYSVLVQPTAILDFETQPVVNFSLHVAPVEGFDGLDFWTTIEVTDEAEPWRTVACLDEVCRPASEQTIELHDDAPAGTQVVTLQFADPDSNVVADPFWRIMRTTPQTDLLRISEEGVLSTTASPDSLGLSGSVEISIAVADAAASASNPISDRVTFTVDIYDDCVGQNCSHHGTCRDQVEAYTCICDDDWTGDDCEDMILSEADAVRGQDDDDTGSIVGIVLGVLLILLIIGATFLFYRNKKRSDRMAMTGLGSRSTIITTVNPVMNPGVYDTVDNTVIVPGVANPLYEWYKPDATKQSAYQELSIAPPGSFVVRDGVTSLSNPMYMLHVKTPQSVIKDVNINGSPGDVKLIEGGYDTPKFATLPELVDHYSEATDQPFVLSRGKVIPAMEGMEMYDNALITNKRVDASGPAVPVKQTQYRS